MKIKQVKIQAFRLFREVTVDLSSTIDHGKASNFIAIYAPNGFGKTSFFDAMEFCVTKSIQRVSVNFKENFKVDQEQDSTTFIHNKDYPDLPIEVTMQFEDRSPIRTVCKPEEESALLKGDAKNHYFRTAILSQDWFSEFLSTSSAEQRFRIFTDNFVKTKDMLNYYRRLSSAFTSFNRNVARINKDLKSLKKEIDDNLNTSVVQQIEDDVKKLADNGIIIKWARKIDEDSIVGLQMERDKIELKLKKEEKEVSEIIKILENYSSGDYDIIHIGSLAEYEKDITEGEEKMARYNAWLEMLKQYNNAESQIEESKKTMALSRQEEAKMLYLITNYASYIALYQKNVNLTNEKDSLMKKIENIGLILDLKIKRKAQLEENLDNYQTELNLNVKVLKEVPVRYQKYETVIKKQTEMEKDLSELRDRLRILNEEYTYLVKQGDNLVNLRRLIEEDNYVEEDNDFIEDIRMIQNVLSRIKSSSEDMDKVVRRIQEKSNLNDELQKLLVSSRLLVEQMQGGKCPLCGTEFETHEFLLKSISENTVLQSSLEDDIQTRNKLQDEVIQQKEILKKKKETLIEKISKAYNTNKSNALNRYDLIQQLKKDIGELENYLDDIKKTLEKEYADIKAISQEDKSNEIQSVIKGLNDKISFARNMLENLEKEMIQINEEVKSHEKQVLSIEESIHLVTSNPLYTEYSQKVGSEIVSQADYETWLIKNDSVKKSIEVQTMLIQSNQEKLDKLKEEGFKREEEQDVLEHRRILKETLSLKKSKWLKTIGFLREHCGLEINQSTKATDIKKLYEQSFEDISKHYAQLKYILSMLEQYGNSLTLGLKYNQNEAKKVELSNKEKILEDETRKRDLILDEKNKLQAYLEDFVKGFFQLDLINKLYNTIDPHPEYKQIDFVCDFKNKDPRLNVVMYSINDGHNIIVPNLYFSTAQINILSFCIFLAKALFAKTDSNEDLGCVFIDDPIQALDDINVLSMIDLLRNVAFSLNRQVILTTHDRNFFEILKKKVPADLFGSRFLELKQRGVFSEG